MRIHSLVIEQIIIIKSLIQVAIPLWIKRHTHPLEKNEIRKNRFLILPCDPYDPSGSMGDLAMLAGLTKSLRENYKDAEFTIIGSRQNTIFVPNVGPTKTQPAWDGWQGSIAFDRLIRQHDALFVLGADVMDGKYGASLVCRFVGYCNHAIYLGRCATITGFSFNTHPRKAAVTALSKLHRRVRLNVRDPVSLSRFKSSINAQAFLSADVAFLMKPSAAINTSIEYWAKERKNKGILLIGININRHAFSNLISDIGTKLFVEKIALELKKTIQNCNIAYILIPHDIKSKSGDKDLLNELQNSAKLLGMTNTTVYASNNPSEIKHVVGILDVLITARMHLAIAALGSGTPVLSITYQDKFEGLYRHFHLPESGILTPEQCTSNIFSETILKTISTRESLARAIEEKIPEITLLARNNITINDKLPNDKTSH